MMEAKVCDKTTPKEKEENKTIKGSASGKGGYPTKQVCGRINDERFLFNAGNAYPTTSVSGDKRAKYEAYPTTLVTGDKKKKEK